MTTSIEKEIETYIEQQKAKYPDRLTQTTANRLLAFSIFDMSDLSDEVEKYSEDEDSQSDLRELVEHQKIQDESQKKLQRIRTLN